MVNSVNIMDRIIPQMHGTLDIKNIQLLNAKQIYTVLEFVTTDSKTIEKITDLSFKVCNNRTFLKSIQVYSKYDIFELDQQFTIAITLYPKELKYFLLKFCS